MFWFLIWLLTAPTLIGRVTDTAGRPIAGAVVRALPENGAPVEASTDGRGRFHLQAPGAFRLQIVSPGFRTLLSSPIDLAGDRVYAIPEKISLFPGASEQIETVDLQVESSGDMPDREEPGAREGLPRADRIFGLRGGVNVTGIAEGAGQQWVAASGSVFTSSSTSKNAVEGSQDFSAEHADAVESDDEALPPGQEALHGNVHYFTRNDIFNSRNFFDPPNAPKPPFKYNLWGGELGGRIRPGAYYYLQYWGLRIRQSVTRATTTPPPEWLKGDFSGSSDTILDPETGLPFLGNRIPVTRFDPVGAALANLYPAPNVPGASIQNYRAVGKLSTNADSFGFRFDRRMSIADEASLEYQYSRDTTEDPFNLLSGITNLPLFGVRDALNTQSLRIQNSHVFSPSLIGQFRFAASHLEQPRTILQSEAGLAPSPAILITGFSNIGHAANLPQDRHNETFEWSGDFSWRRSASATKFGAAIRYFPFHASLDLYSRGQFQFTPGIFTNNAFANLLLGLPTNALRMEGNSARNFRTWTTSAYIQHEWRPVSQLRVDLGVRYDFQSPYSERDGLAANFNPATAQMETDSGGLYRADRNNFAPRVGIAWQAPGGIVVRAGYGIYYDMLVVGDSLFLLGLNPPFVHFIVENNGPVVPGFKLSTAFSDTSETSIPPSVFSTSPSLPNPYLQRWTLSLSRSIGRNLVIDASYSGEKGTHLRRQLNLNQPLPGPLDTLDDRRPFAGFRNIFQFETSASSIGHALEARITRRFQGRFAAAASYRLSKTIDDATLISILPQDSRNLRAERGLSDFDMRHRLTLSGTYNLPQVKLLRDWQLQAVGVFQSGTPLSAILGADYAGVGSPIVNRPDLVGDPNIGNPTPSRFFNSLAFRIPEAGRFGNSGRNVIIGPGSQNIDLSLIRVFRMSDLTRLQFRTDIYNALNHPNFIAPPSMQNFADSPDFGALFVARSPRIVQFGLKFLW